MRTAEIAAIVLAAGQGTRFGEPPKMLVELDGKPLVRHAVEAALGSSANAVLVVVGHREAEVRAALGGLPVTFVPNPDYADGLSTSLRSGFAARPDAAEACIVLLGDMPRVTSAVIDRLVAAWREAGRPSAAVPIHDGQRGNPVLLSVKLAGEIAQLTGDAGAGPLLRGRADVLEWPAPDEAVALDVDTPDALARLDQVASSTTPPRMAE
jgi:molybdenum cofactor cytidylyltransferase